MSEKMFNPSSPEYKKVEDLPKEEQKNFADIGKDRFARKEAKEEFDNAKKIVELANQFKEAGIDPKTILSKRIRPGMLKNVAEAVRDNKTEMDILHERAEGEKFKPIDALHAEANEINQREHPEDFYIQRIKDDPENLKGIPKRIWANKRFALEAVKANWEALRKIDNFGRFGLNAKDYLEVVHEAMKQDGLALQYARNNLTKDKDIVLEAVKQNPAAIRYAPKEIQEALKRLF